MNTLVQNVRSLSRDLLSFANKEVDLLLSKQVDISDIRTVCLTLGPYRNLTTLTAAILFLHPECQVLNHGGGRVFNDNRLDFLKDYSGERFQAFTKYAIYTSRLKRRGGQGGSITHSHAFDAKYAMKEIFESSSLGVLKKDIRCLFWKESHWTSNRIRGDGINLGDIFSRNRQLRFLLPVRNPLDCAASNLKFFRSRRVGGFGVSSIQEAVDIVLDEFAWFADLRKAHPDRFFTYFEHDFTRETLRDLAAFLQLEAPEEWIRTALAAFKVSSSYEHSPDLWDFYRQHVRTQFAEYPEFATNLMRFAEGPASTQPLP